MERKLLKKDTFTAEYRFAKDLVKAVIEMRTIYVPNFCSIQLDDTFLTTARKNKVRELFKVEWPRLDEHVKRFTEKEGRSDYSDERFLLCVVQFIEEYKPELKSDVEFLLVSSRIAYVAAIFMRKNDRSDAVSVAVDRVYEMLIDTFYASTINENGPLVKDFRDRKYRFAHYLVRTLLQMRGVTVPDLELPNSDNGLFTTEHKHKIEETFAKEWNVLDELVKSYTCRDGTQDYSDENLSRYMDKIVENLGSKQNTEDEFVKVCARIAYAAALFMRENSYLDAMDLAVDRIHQMVKESFYFNKYDQDDDYRFSCDFVKTIFDMRSNPFSVAEMSHAGNFFMIAHRNKFEDFLSTKRLYLDEMVRKCVSNGEILDYNDRLFLLCMDKIKDNYKPKYKSKEEMIHVCAEMAYVAACFLRNNSISNAPGLAMDSMLEIVKDIRLFSNSKDEDVLIMHTQDDHYRFAYDLVKAVFEMKSVLVSDIDLSDPENFLFTEMHRNAIELVLKESSQFDKVVEKLTKRYGQMDYSDSNFLRSMYEIIKMYHYDQKTEEGLVCIGTIVAYLSVCFSKGNCKSNAPFMAVNRIYEISKDVNCFKNSKEEQVIIVKAHDEHYRFAYDLIKKVFDIKGIPVSPIDLPDPENRLFTDEYQNKIQDLFSKETSQFDEMIDKLAKKGENLNFSDSRFLYCMNQILQDYKSDQNTEEEFLHVCSQVAYTASVFLIKNHKSNATFLAVNRMYEMSKYVFRNKMEEASVQDENYHFAYDLVRAALGIISNSAFKVEMQDPEDSPFTNKHRHDVQEFLSKEWPCLHHIVRRFTKTCTDIAFSDGHFLHCIQQMINNNGPEQKSEEGLLILSARIAYLATCFLMENQNSNAADFALDRIYQMRKKFYRTRNTMAAKSLVVDVRDNKYRFAYDLVQTVMELQNSPGLDIELPHPDKLLFTSEHKKKIKKLLQREFSILNKHIEKVTNNNGNIDYSDDAFQNCMDQIFQKFKYEQADQHGFVRLCARIAYSASYFVRKNSASNATTLVVRRIHEMVSNIVYFNEDLEDNSFLKDAENDKYRFAYDLVTAVVEMHGSPLPNIELPDPKNFLFTDEHKQNLQGFFLKESTHIVDLTNMFTCKDGKLDYSDKGFTECMEQIIKECKPDTYSEEGFVLLCGRIAFVASCFFRKMCKSNATALAVNRIHEMVEDIFSRGTLSQSSW